MEWNNIPGFGDASTGGYQIHYTRQSGWIRKKTKNGKWTYSGSSRLVGSIGKPRVYIVNIKRRLYLRHRLAALASGKMTIDQFNDPDVFVMHIIRRGEDERPDDSPENLVVGSAKENNNDPGNKKRKANPGGIPVLVTDVLTDGKEEFGSVSEAASFLDANRGSLTRYLNREVGSGLTMPACGRNGTWRAIYNEFDLPDAVRIVRASAELYLSPSRHMELFRRLKTGKFSTTELERGDNGYIRARVVGGGKECLHRLFADTLEPAVGDSRAQ
jgi:hypothetical protein